MRAGTSQQEADLLARAKTDAQRNGTVSNPAQVTALIEKNRSLILNAKAMMSKDGFDIE